MLIKIISVIIISFDWGYNVKISLPHHSGLCIFWQSQVKHRGLPHILKRINKHLLKWQYDENRSLFQTFFGIYVQVQKLKAYLSDIFTRSCYISHKVLTWLTRWCHISLYPFLWIHIRVKLKADMNCSPVPSNNDENWRFQHWILLSFYTKKNLQCISWGKNNAYRKIDHTATLNMSAINCKLWFLQCIMW